jgi:hypothetical protein
MPQELDYLLEEPMQKEILDAWHEEQMVTDSEVDGKNVLLMIPQSNDYTALHESYLMITCKVTKPKGAACDSAAQSNPDKVCIVNNFAQSLWRNVKIEINGKEVEDTHGLHPYRAYFESLFSHQAFVLDKRKGLIGWTKDTAGKFDKNLYGGGNTGMDARTAPFLSSAEVTLVCKPACDLMREKLYLPPNMTISVRLERAPNNFVLIAGAEATEYEVHLTSMKFFVRRIKIRPEVSVAHKMLFASLPENRLRIPARRTTVSKFVVNKDVKYAQHALFQNCTLPDRILVAFISKTASGGLYTENPFNLMNKNVEEIYLTVNSKQYPRVKYSPDFTKKNGYIREYYETLEFFGAHEGNTTLDLTYEDYAGGFTVFPFCLSPRRENGTLLGEQQTGIATLTINFREALTDVCEIIVLAETRAQIIIDNVLKNTTS